MGQLKLQALAQPAPSGRPRGLRYQSFRTGNRVAVNNPPSAGGKVNAPENARVAGDMIDPAVLMLVVADSHPAFPFIVGTEERLEIIHFAGEKKRRKFLIRRRFAKPE